MHVKGQAACLSHSKCLINACANYYSCKRRYLPSRELQIPNAPPHFSQKFYMINSHCKARLLYQPFPERDLKNDSIINITFIC